MSTEPGTGSGTGAGTGGSTSGSQTSNSSGGTKVVRGFKSSKLKFEKKDFESLKVIDSYTGIANEAIFDQIVKDWKEEAELDESKALSAMIQLCIANISNGYSDKLEIEGKIEGVEASLLLSILEETTTFRRVARLFANHIWNYTLMHKTPPANAYKFTTDDLRYASIEIVEFVGSPLTVMPEGGIRRKPSKKELMAAAAIRDAKLLKADRKAIKTGGTSAYITQGIVEGDLPNIS